MKKTIFIAAVVIIFAFFILALLSTGQTETRAAGQCSYHGGLNKDTGMCKDGTSPGAQSGPDCSKRGGLNNRTGNCNEAKKPVPASYLKYHNESVSNIESLYDQKEGCETDKCLEKIDKKIAKEDAKVTKYCQKILKYDPDFTCGMH